MTVIVNILSFYYVKNIKFQISAECHVQRQRRNNKMRSLSNFLPSSRTLPSSDSVFQWSNKLGIRPDIPLVQFSRFLNLNIVFTGWFLQRKLVHDNHSMLQHFFVHILHAQVVELAQHTTKLIRPTYYNFNSAVNSKI